MDISQITTLAAVVLVFSAAMVIFDQSGRSEGSKPFRSPPLLWAHVCFIIAAAGIELGTSLPLYLSTAIVITGALCGIVIGFIDLKATMLKQPPNWEWCKIAIGLGLAQALLVYLTGNLAATFVSSSLINASLAFYFLIMLQKSAQNSGFKAVWLLTLPFGAISLAYLARLTLIALDATAETVVLASVGIALVLPMAAMSWVFGAISLRNFHLTKDLDWSANRDPLTGLLNRASLERLTSRMPVRERRKSGRVTACICIDLDLFKEVNDTYGHEAGDTVLVAVADRLSECAKDDDKVFRIGGDEFVFWREDCDSESLNAFLADILARITAPILFGEITLRVGSSIGVHTSSATASPWDLIRCADIALYTSKEAGRNQITSYDDRLGKLHDDRLLALKEFRGAVENGQICVYFQPQLEVSTGRVSGCEALARWNHPTRGLLLPSDFMAYAVELDLLAEVDRQVLELAVSAHEAWQKCGFYIPRISVNVSASRLQNNALIFDLQERSDLPFEKLSFEVLETALIDEDPAIIWNVDSLREMGVGIEVDDFGTGHASLSSVLAIRPDRVKIDRSFVIGIEADEKKREFLEVLISLAKRVGASTTVEGVETDDHKRIVSELGATEFQGFAIARPMSADAMMKWLAERTTGTVAVRCSSVDSAHCNTGD